MLHQARGPDSHAVKRTCKQGCFLKSKQDEMIHSTGDPARQGAELYQAQVITSISAALQCGKRKKSSSRSARY